MKKYITSIMLASLAICLFSCGGGDKEAKVETKKEKPVEHLKLKDITSADVAKKVFAEETAALKTKTKLDAKELHEIHMITYKLEKGLQYFAKNLKGDQKKAAEKLAEVLEEVHLNSEKNKSNETKAHLDEYFTLAETFSKAL